MVANYAAYVKSELDMLSMRSVLVFKREATTFLSMLHEREILVEQEHQSSKPPSQLLPSTSRQAESGAGPAYSQQWEHGQQREHSRAGSGSMPTPPEVAHSPQSPHMPTLGHSTSLANLSMSSSLMAAFGAYSPGPSENMMRTRTSTPGLSTPRREYSDL